MLGIWEDGLDGLLILIFGLPCAMIVSAGVAAFYFGVRLIAHADTSN
ncbi:MAG: hypothetical protein AAGJ51_09795 [Pseudomonadota bacterium]